MTEALVYAHGQGVIHRDLRAGKILLEAGSERALVTDFGVELAYGLAAGLRGRCDRDGQRDQKHAPACAQHQRARCRHIVAA